MTGLSQRLQQAESRIETRRLLVTVQTATSPRRYPAITKRLFVSSKVKTSAWASRLSGFWGNELENGRANQSLPSSPLISAGTRRSISVPPSFWMLLTVALSIFNMIRHLEQCPLDVLPSPQSLCRMEKHPTLPVAMHIQPAHYNHRNQRPRAEPCWSSGTSKCSVGP